MFGRKTRTKLYDLEGQRFWWQQENRRLKDSLLAANYELMRYQKLYGNLPKEHRDASINV